MKSDIKLFSSATAIFPTTKNNIARFVSNLVEELLDGGEVNLLEAESKFACMEAITKKIRGDEEYKSALLEQAEREGLKTFKAFDSSFCIKEVVMKYDFSQCGHLLYDKVCRDIELLTETKKAIEKQIKANPKGYIYVDPDTGESYFVNPCSKTSTTQVVTTISQ